MIRPMRPADLPAVAAIEAQAYADPWSLSIFQNSLQVGYHGWCLEHSGLVAGYALVVVQLDEAHLLNICISPAHQGEGLGRTLLTHIIDWARAQHLQSMWLEVRVSNDNALSLYRSLGFLTAGIRKEYYPASTTAQREDAIVLSLSLL